MSAIPDITLRDYFAAAALKTASVVYELDLSNREERELVAKECYAMADEMLAARRRHETD